MFDQFEIQTFSTEPVYMLMDIIIEHLMEYGEFELTMYSLLKPFGAKYIPSSWPIQIEF